MLHEKLNFRKGNLRSTIRSWERSPYPTYWRGTSSGPSYLSRGYVSCLQGKLYTTFVVNQNPWHQTVASYRWQRWISTYLHTGDKGGGFNSNMYFLISSSVGKIILCSWLVFWTPPAVREDVFLFCKTAKNLRLSREANSSLMRLGRETKT